MIIKYFAKTITSSQKKEEILDNIGGGLRSSQNWLYFIFALWYYGHFQHKTKKRKGFPNHAKNVFQKNPKNL